MGDPKGNWYKAANIVAKFLVPVVITFLGYRYTAQQQTREESQRAMDRVVGLVKILAGTDPREQRIAMTLLRSEKEKHPDVVPEELLAVTIPELVQLAATASSADLAAEAKQLAIDLSANTRIAEPVRNSVGQVPARIYFHIRDERQRQDAAADALQLQTKLGEDFVVPGIQRVSRGPANTVLKYFRQGEKAEAERIVAALTDAGMGDVSLAYGEGHEASTSIRPRHYELWYGRAVEERRRDQ